LQFIKLLDSGLPKMQEHIRLHPFLKAIMRGGTSTQIGRIQGLPLTTSAQHKKDGIRTAAISNTRSASTKAVRIRMRRQQGLQDLPQLVRDAESRGRAIIRRALAFALGWYFLSHTSYCIRFFG
jgi:hypothetical protein